MLIEQTDHDKIRALILLIPPIAVPEPADDPIIPKHSVGFEGSGAGRKEDFEEKKKLTLTLEQMVAFNPNADALYPGALIQGKSLPDGVLSPIATKRTDLDITVTDLVHDAPGTSYSQTVANPALATVTDAVQRILDQNLTTQQPAKITYTQSSTNSVEEGFLRLGASYHWLSGNVSGSFQQSAITTNSRFLVRFVQSYFTVSCATPTDPASFIANEASYDSFAIYAGTSNPPVYISSVTYGRELWMLIESTYQANQMSATLDAAFGSGLTGGTINLSDEQRKIISESSIQVLLLGGAGTPAIQLVTGDKVTGLQNYLLAGANYSKSSPGVIISYTCRYLLSTDVAKVSSSTEYTIRTSKPNPVPPITLVSGLFQFHTGSDDKDDDNHVGIRFTLDNGTVLHENGDLPPKQPQDDDPTWHDDTSNPPDHYFFVPFATSNINTDIRRSITVTIWKSGGAHWHFGFTFIVVDSDGKQYVIGSMGSNDNNFGGDHNSDQWTYSLPERA